MRRQDLGYLFGGQWEWSSSLCEIWLADFGNITVNYVRLFVSSFLYFYFLGITNLYRSAISLVRTWNLDHLGIPPIDFLEFKKRAQRFCAMNSSLSHDPELRRGSRFDWFSIVIYLVEKLINGCLVWPSLEQFSVIFRCCFSTKSRVNAAKAILRLKPDKHPNFGFFLLVSVFKSLISDLQRSFLRGAPSPNFGLESKTPGRSPHPTTSVGVDFRAENLLFTNVSRIYRLLQTATPMGRVQRASLLY